MVMPDEMAMEPEFEGKPIETLKTWFTAAEDAHSEARTLAHRDRDWYDNYNDSQWDTREKKILQRRGQPIVTSNRIKRKVNFLCGVEQKQRSDPKAFPRQPDKHDQAAVATDVLQYIENETRFDRTSSISFRSMILEGIAAVDVCVENGTDIEVKCIDYDQFFYDPRSREQDFSDARYIGYQNWYDRADAEDMFPDADPNILEATLSLGSVDEGYEDKPATQWGDIDRKRVRIACMYYRTGKDEWAYAYFTGAGVLEEGLSKYQDEDGYPCCPIIAVSAYVTRNNERYGAVRDMISPQSEMNYRRSMALYLLKNRRMWAMAGVLPQKSEAKEEVARADGILEVNGVFGQDWGFVESASEIAGNFELLQEAKSEIDAQGPNAGLQGRGTENQSGRAILAQQNAGLAEENTLFDAHNDWKLRVYRAMWSRAKQFWTEPDFIRIVDQQADGGARFTAVNQPQMQMNPMTGAPAIDPMTGQPQVSIMNSLAEMDVDFIIDAAPDLITLQHEQFQELAQLVEAGVPIPPDVILEASQLKDKQGLANRIKEEASAQAQLAHAQQMIQQLQKQLQQMQQQAGQTLSPLDQVRAQTMMREADRKDYAAQVDGQYKQAQTAKTIREATEPRQPLDFAQR